MLSSHYIAHINDSITRAERGESKLADFHLKLEGMSSFKGRRLLNNLCSVSLPRKLRYLEVGSWKGSTLCSATYSNDIEAVAIDNFSQFTTTSFGTDRRHPRESIASNLEASLLFSKPPFTATILDSDAFAVAPAALGLFDVYLYDGEHSYEAHYKGITHFAPALAETAILVVDDYRNLPEDGVHQATQQAIKDLGLKIHAEHFLYDEVDGTPEGKMRTGWWNGMYVAVVSKS